MYRDTQAEMTSAAYSAAKAALTNLMESLRIDLGPRGVAVTVIAPGFVRTKPGPGRKPFRVDLEPATERIWRAIRARRAYFAFPRSLVALAWFGRVLPARWYDRLLVGRGPRAKRKRLAAPNGSAPTR